MSATKSIGFPELEDAVRRVGTPETAEDATHLAEAVAEATANIRRWVLTEARQHFKRAPVRSAAYGSFVSSLTELTQEFVGLRTQLASWSASQPGADPLVTLRYAIARQAFDSDTEMAETLGVHRSQITRWKQGAAPAGRTAEHLLGLDVVVSLLQGFLESESIAKWLRGINAHLGNRRPIDVMREGRLSEVIRAIEAEKEGAFA